MCVQCAESDLSQDQHFKNANEDGLKLLSFLLRRSSILLEGCAGTKPGAGYLMLQLT